MRSTITLIFSLYLGYFGLISCRGVQRDSISIKYISSMDFGQEHSQMTFDKIDSTWSTKLIENGGSLKVDHLTLFQKTALDKFIEDLKNFTETEKASCTTVDFYEVAVGNEIIKRQDECGDWMRYKLLKQQLFPNK